MQKFHYPKRVILSLGLVLTAARFIASSQILLAQAAAPAARVTPQRGTVKTIEGNTLTMTTDAGPAVRDFP